ncbi:peptide-methionine (S)-S-oxide reductase MsrA [Leucobacter sp. OH1287]|uniref:peptide-methionine (S)-S-oxide reductase MsrA n=1 Tax=Leucobacter sp. OH1287 TaxID=2491049 RepID=UPI000F5E0561|nr:peptide-methionine (S)-S-oxide reductase MsrA [Leucobacter sp. OH1287]RRD60225.1 peptide-methionine (S)-S-oxide reductase [Leucobacter sp. OH1287]
MTQTVVLGGGCFWCLDAAYRSVKGVSDVVSGYTGGSVPNPDYRSVCQGTTGHAEVVAVTFDEETVPFDVILDIFFTIHDPTQLNRQGNDVGTQYRSAVFYADPDQLAAAQSAVERARQLWDGEIVTELAPLGEFWDAEEYHQNYFAKNPTQAYCLAVAVPKVQKVRANFAKWYRGV